MRNLSNLLAFTALSVCSMAAEGAESGGTTTTPAAADKRKTTLEGMTGYRTFDSTDEASAYLEKCGADFTDFADQTFALNGLNTETGEYDPAIYTDDMRVRVAVLKNVPRSVNGKKEPTTIKAIVVTPVPSIPAILGLDAEQWEGVKESPSVKWMTKILDKELNHVAVRPLRDAENIETAVEQMPRTLAGFIESSRDSSGILDTFNDLYKIIGDKMGERAQVWAKARLNKSDLKKAMESTAYALEYYPSLEDRGEGKDSLFVVALKFGQALAKKKALDPAIFDKWLATRDQQTLAKTDADDSDDLSLDDLVADLDNDDADEEQTDDSATVDTATA